MLLCALSTQTNAKAPPPISCDSGYSKYTLSSATTDDATKGNKQLTWNKGDQSGKFTINGPAGEINVTLTHNSISGNMQVDSPRITDKNTLDKDKALGFYREKTPGKTSTNVAGVRGSRIIVAFDKPVKGFTYTVSDIDWDEDNNYEDQIEAVNAAKIVSWDDNFVTVETEGKSVFASAIPIYNKKNYCNSYYTDRFDSCKATVFYDANKAESNFEIFFNNNRDHSLPTDGHTVAIDNYQFCVQARKLSISGEVYIDSDFMTNRVDGTPSNLGKLYAQLEDKNNNVVAYATVSSKGKYTIKAGAKDGYKVTLTVEEPQVGSPAKSVLPNAYQVVSESAPAPINEQLNSGDASFGPFAINGNQAISAKELKTGFKQIAKLKLKKTWQNAQIGDKATLSVENIKNAKQKTALLKSNATKTSLAETSSQSIVVFADETVKLSEAMDSNNQSQYDRSDWTCVDDNNNNYPVNKNELSIQPKDAGKNIVCNITNTKVLITPPIAKDDGIITIDTNKSSVVIDVLANAVTGTEPLVKIEISDKPKHGKVSINDNGTPNDVSDDSFSYTANPNYSGKDKFSYKIIDGKGNESVAVVRLAISKPFSKKTPQKTSKAPTKAIPSLNTLSILILILLMTVLTMKKVKLRRLY